MFDLSKFKKIHANATHTMMKHPEGHVIHVAHASLPEEQREHLRSLPIHKDPKAPKLAGEVKKFAGGGKVPLTAPGPWADRAENFGGFIADKTGLLTPEMEQHPELSMEGPMPREPEYPPLDPARLKGDAVTPEGSFGVLHDAMSGPQTAQGMEAPSNYPLASPTPQGPSDPFGTQEYMKHMSAGLSEQQRGIQQGAQAEGELGRQQSQYLSDQVQGLNDLDFKFQNEHSNLLQEREHLLSDYQNGHIDPNHYLHSMGSGQKVATAIGLILGGMGAGIGGGENPALQFLQSQIDRDIKAQESNLGKKRSLLEANHQAMGNLRDATSLTRANMMDLTAAQLKAAAARAMDPLAKARALQAAGELEMKSAPIMAQLAMQRSMLSGMKSGQVEPSQVIRMVVDPKHQETAYKELKDAQTRVSVHKNAMDVWDQLDKSIGAGNVPFNSAKRKAMLEPIKLQMARDTAGRVNEYELPGIEAMFPAQFDAPGTRQLKRKKLDEFIREKHHYPVLDSYGITPTLSGARPIPSLQMKAK